MQHRNQFALIFVCVVSAANSADDIQNMPPHKDAPVSVKDSFNAILNDVKGFDETKATEVIDQLDQMESVLTRVEAVKGKLSNIAELDRKIKGEDKKKDLSKREDDSDASLPPSRRSYVLERPTELMAVPAETPKPRKPSSPFERTYVAYTSSGAITGESAGEKQAVIVHNGRHVRLVEGTELEGWTVSSISDLSVTLKDKKGKSIVISEGVVDGIKSPGPNADMAFGNAR